MPLPPTLLQRQGALSFYDKATWKLAIKTDSGRPLATIDSLASQPTTPSTQTPSQIQPQSQTSSESPVPREVLDAHIHASINNCSLLQSVLPELDGSKLPQTPLSPAEILRMTKVYSGVSI